MASDIKISQMPAADALEGSELIPIVLSGANKTTTVSKIKEGLATTAQLNNKVDRDGSKVLSDVNFTTTLKNKLDGIAEGANNYVLPAAGTSIGGVKQGAAVTDATSADDVITQLNALLTSLRNAGVIAGGAAAASLNVMSVTEDIIEFIPPMSIQKDKLYSEEGIVYKCIQTSKLPISNKLSELVGYYVEVYK